MSITPNPVPDVEIEEVRFTALPLGWTLLIQESDGGTYRESCPGIMKVKHTRPAHMQPWGQIEKEVWYTHEPTMFDYSGSLIMVRELEGAKVVECTGPIAYEKVEKDGQ